MLTSVGCHNLKH